MLRCVAVVLAVTLANIVCAIMGDAVGRFVVTVTLLLPTVQTTLLALTVMLAAVKLVEGVAPVIGVVVCVVPLPTAH